MLFRYGNARCAKILVAKGADCALENMYGTSALHFAGRRGDLPTCTLLLNQANVKVNAPDKGMVSKDDYDSILFGLMF